MKFTEKYIASLKPSDKKYFVLEGMGFKVQVLPTGTKSFVYVYQLNKKKTLMTLGVYPGISLAKARELYNDAYKLVKNGINPVTLKAIAAGEERQVLLEEMAVASVSFESLLEEGIPEDFIPTTVGQLAAVYYLKYSATHHTSNVHRNLLYAIRDDFLNEFGSKKINEVRRSAAIALIDKVATRAPGQSGNVLKAGRQIFEYALQREWAEIQPFLAVSKAVPKSLSTPRERTLNDDEIRQAWTEVKSCSAYKESKHALLLILVTAQREGEIVQMHRSQIDERWWTIPAKVTKNRREHRVYLTDLAMELICDNKGYIFPSERGGIVETHIAPNTVAQIVNRGEVTDEVVKRIGNRNVKARGNKYFGMAHWTPHDLRRTARTNMARIGISDEVAEAVLNHKKAKLVGTYNKYSYDEEKKNALIAWEEFLREILTKKPKGNTQG